MNDYSETLVRYHAPAAQRTVVFTQRLKALAPLELVVVNGPHYGHRFPVNPGRQRYGRATESELCFDHPTVSLRHGAIDYTEAGEVTVYDLSSLNGIFVDGRGAPVLQLKVGRTIQIGALLLKLIPTGSSPYPIGRRKWWRLLFLLIAAGALLAVSACATASHGMIRQALRDDLQAAEQLIQSGRYRQAVDDLSLMLEWAPKNSELYWLRGLAYQKWGRFREAATDYHQLLQEEPHSFKAHYNLGMILAFQLADPKQALTHFDQFLSLKPQHAEAVHVARVMTALDDGEDETVGLAVATQELIQKAAAADTLEDKSTWLRQGIQAAPDSPIFYYGLGQAYESFQKDKQAIAAYRKALACRPTCAPCHRSLGNLLLQNKDLSSSRIHLLKADLFSFKETQLSNTSIEARDDVSSDSVEIAPR